MSGWFQAPLIVRLQSCDTCSNCTHYRVHISGLYLLIQLTQVTCVTSYFFSTTTHFSDKMCSQLDEHSSGFSFMKLLVTSGTFKRHFGNKQVHCKLLRETLVTCTHIARFTLVTLERMLSSCNWVNQAQIKQCSYKAKWGCSDRNL